MRFSFLAFFSFILFSLSTSYAQEAIRISDEDFTIPLDVPNVGDADISVSNVENAFDEDNFFDANDVVPQSQMGKEGPINVDPRFQPGSKFVIVSKMVKPDLRSSKMVAAERAMNLGLYDSALEMFEDLHAENKKDARVLNGRAVALQKLGRFDEAMQAYEMLSELEPDNLEIKVNMLGLMGTRYPSIALRRLSDLYQEHKENVFLTAQLAVAYAQNGNVAVALKYLGVASSMEPRNASHIFNMAVITDRAGDLNKAISFYEKSLEIDSVHGGGHSVPREKIYERLAQIR